MQPLPIPHCAVQPSYSPHRKSDPVSTHQDPLLIEDTAYCRDTSRAAKGKRSGSPVYQSPMRPVYRSIGKRKPTMRPPFKFSPSHRGTIVGPSEHLLLPDWSFRAGVPVFSQVRTCGMHRDERPTQTLMKVTDEYEPL